MLADVALLSPVLFLPMVAANVNCDRIARWYRWIEYAGFGRALERRREAFLDDVSDARRVLALGDGDGRALAACWRPPPTHASITSM